jgi:hypothetical protein
MPCATTAACAGVFGSDLDERARIVAGLRFAAACHAVCFFKGAGLVAFATALLTRTLAGVFFTATVLVGSSFFSLNSKAGFGRLLSCRLIRESNAAGLTPAADAALAADALSEAGRGFASTSGLTITWLS